MNEPIKELEKATADLDFIYQDGVIFNTSDVKSLKIVVGILQGIIDDLENTQYSITEVF